MLYSYVIQERVQNILNLSYEVSNQLKKIPEGHVESQVPGEILPVASVTLRPDILLVTCPGV